jgi:hypothetical protein
MHKSVLLAIGGLALAAASGANAEFRAPGDLIAQASPSAPGSSPSPSMDRDRPSTPPAASPSSPGSGATSPGASPSSPGASSSSPGMGKAVSAEWKGKDLVDSTGDKIGEIKDVQGEKVIVSVGGFLGIGQKDVEMSGDRLNATGSGSDLKVQTTMTKDQIKDLPEHRAPAGTTGSGSPSSPSPSRTPSPGGTSPTR